MVKSHVAGDSPLKSCFNSHLSWFPIIPVPFLIHDLRVLPQPVQVQAEKDHETSSTLPDAGRSGIEASPHRIISKKGKDMEQK